MDPQIQFLNHGSFGACLRSVLAAQRGWRDRMERQPVQFFVRELEDLLDHARAKLARFVGVSAKDLVFVCNATAGVNSVLRSLRFRSGDELLVTDQEYNACRNALDFVAERCGARVVVARVPFPLQHPDQALEALLACLTRRTRLVLVDHVTSQTGLVFPLKQWMPHLKQKGAEILVDGAHAPGMVPLEIRKLGATYYTGNCHKWLGAPKVAGFLWVRSDQQRQIRPLVISHGATSPREDRSRYRIEFDWTGTRDPSAWLTVPQAITDMAALLPGGWPEIRRRNRRLALAAQRLVSEGLGIERPCPATMVGSLVALPLSPGEDALLPKSPLYEDPLQDWLLSEHRIEVPIIPWPHPPARVLRVSAQLYNHLDQYRRLAMALGQAN